MIAWKGMLRHCSVVGSTLDRPFAIRDQEIASSVGNMALQHWILC